MRKAFRHTGVLMMLGVVALGLVGAAYTLWFEDLQLNVTASTGTFNANVSVHPWNGSEFVDGTGGTGQTAEGSYPSSGHPVVKVFTTIADQGSRAADHYGYADYVNFPIIGGVQKPPTTCDSTIGHFGSIGLNTNDVVDANQLNLIMGQLFPYAGCEYEIDIHNSGTVPLHISLAAPGAYQRCDNNGNNCQTIDTAHPALSLLFDNTGDSRCSALLGAGAPTTGDNAGQLQLSGVPVQLHTGEELKCKLKVIMDEAYDGENVQYHIQLNWRAYQWNELPAPGAYPAPQFNDGVPGHTQTYVH